MLAQQLLNAIPAALDTVDLTGFGEKEQGKTRDIYHLDANRRLLITTDRVNAFDQRLELIPCKGQVINQHTAWWFAQTRDIVANCLISVPDPNVMVVREAQTLPMELIVSGYITDMTSANLWSLYAQGGEQHYGLDLPRGLQKNDRLPQPVIIPILKAEQGGPGRPLAADEVVKEGLVDPELWEEVKRVAMALYKRGQYVAMRGGLVLVDSRYRFGIIHDRLVLIDEIHTPDSSHYWIASSYEPNRKAGRDPDNFDREYLRKWIEFRRNRGGDRILAMPPDFIAQVATRYIDAFEKLTLEMFEPAELPASERIARNLEGLRYWT